MRKFLSNKDISHYARPDTKQNCFPELERNTKPCLVYLQRNVKDRTAYKVL